MDGDCVFAAGTGFRPLGNAMADLTDIGSAMADCLARAIARGVFEATALTVGGPLGVLPDWRSQFG